MLKKSIQLLKNNPVIILFYVLYLVVTLGLFAFLYPKSFGVETFSTNGMFDYSLYLIAIRNILVAIFLIFLISLFFISGYYNMLREAVFAGKTKVATFFDGIKIYFVRVLLSTLLMGVVTIVFSILLGILSVPFTMMAVSNGMDSLLLITSALTVVVMLLVLIPAPFVVLWYPALFLENTGVLKSLSLGARAGAKNYLRLLLITFLLMLPQMIYSISNYNLIMEDTLYSVGFYIMLGIMAVVAIIYNIYLFIVYHEYRLGLVTLQQQSMSEY
jgi:hypothetical protein